MTAKYNEENVLVSFTTHRKLSRTNLGTNMVANSLLGHSRTSGPAPDLYTIYLTEETFFAEYSRKSLHGSMPKKVTKLDIPIEDIVNIELVSKDGDEFLHLRSDWGKEYLFNIESDTTRELALQMIEYIENKKRK
ncbi:MAG: hypothetical protein RR561_01985 [Peptostreptococcus sp.]|uniref:hypothetical protein n=1 Tax=Peptostreptococcus sp. TaxID=1262 RepID=UPI002FC65005